MGMPHSIHMRGALPLILLLIATLSCTLLSGTPTPTPGPAASGNGNSNGNSNPDKPAPTPTVPTSTPSPSPTVPTRTPSPTPTSITPTQIPLPSAGPYVVKQIETLGGEVISGIVCNLTRPFSVNSNTPKVSFVFVFVPQDAGLGTVTYAYSIPSAGETHDAKGNYTLSSAGADGTLLLSMAVSDHVTFKGFDGNIPNHSKFDLVPTATATCP